MSHPHQDPLLMLIFPRGNTDAEIGTYLAAYCLVPLLRAGHRDAADGSIAKLLGKQGHSIIAFTAFASLARLLMKHDLHTSASQSFRASISATLFCEGVGLVSEAASSIYNYVFGRSR